MLLTLSIFKYSLKTLDPELTHPLLGQVLFGVVGQLRKFSLLSQNVIETASFE